MTPTSLDAILQRALAEPAFADLLFADPATALAGYNLSAEDKAALKAISREQFRRHGELDGELRADQELLRDEELAGVAGGGGAIDSGTREGQHNEAMLEWEAWPAGLPEPAEALPPERTLP